MRFLFTKLTAGKSCRVARLKKSVVAMIGTKNNPVILNRMSLPTKRLDGTDDDSKNCGYVALSQVSRKLGGDPNAYFCQLSDGTISRTRQSRDLARCLMMDDFVDNTAKSLDISSGTQKTWADTLSVPYEIDENGDGVKCWNLHDIDNHVPSRQKMEAIGIAYGLADYTIAVLDKVSAKYLEDIKKAIDGIEMLPHSVADMITDKYKVKVEDNSKVKECDACLEDMHKKLEEIVNFFKICGQLQTLGPYSYWSRAWTAQEQHYSTTIIYVSVEDFNGNIDPEDEELNMTLDDYCSKAKFKEVARSRKMFWQVNSFDMCRRAVREWNLLSRTKQTESALVNKKAGDFCKYFDDNYDAIRYVMERSWEILSGTEQTQSSRAVLYKDLSMRGVAAHNLISTDKYATSKEDLISALSIMLKIPGRFGNGDEAWYEIQKAIMALGNVPFPDAMCGKYERNGWQLSPRLFSRIPKYTTGPEANKYHNKHTHIEKLKLISEAYSKYPYESYSNGDIKQPDDSNMMTIATSGSLKTFMHRGSEYNNVIVNRSGHLCFKHHKIEKINVIVMQVCKFRRQAHGNNPIPESNGGPMEDYVSEVDFHIPCDNNTSIERHGRNAYLSEDLEREYIGPGTRRVSGQGEWIMIDDLVLRIQKNKIVLAFRLTLEEYRKVRDENIRNKNVSGYKICNYNDE